MAQASCGLHTANQYSACMGVRRGGKGFINSLSLASARITLVSKKDSAHGV